MDASQTSAELVLAVCRDVVRSCEAISALIDGNPNDVNKTTSHTNEILSLADNVSDKLKQAISDEQTRLIDSIAEVVLEVPDYEETLGYISSKLEGSSSNDEYAIQVKELEIQLRNVLKSVKIEILQDEIAHYYITVYYDELRTSLNETKHVRDVDQAYHSKALHEASVLLDECHLYVSFDVLEAQTYTNNLKTVLAELVAKVKLLVDNKRSALERMLYSAQTSITMIKKGLSNDNITNDAFNVYMMSLSKLCKSLILVVSSSDRPSIRQVIPTKRSLAPPAVPRRKISDIRREFEAKKAPAPTAPLPTLKRDAKTNKPGPPKMPLPSCPSSPGRHISSYAVPPSPKSQVESDDDADRKRSVTQTRKVPPPVPARVLKPRSFTQAHSSQEQKPKVKIPVVVEDETEQALLVADKVEIGVTAIDDADREVESKDETTKLEPVPETKKRKLELDVSILDEATLEQDPTLVMFEVSEDQECKLAACSFNKLIEAITRGPAVSPSADVVLPVGRYFPKDGSEALRLLAASNVISDEAFFYTYRLYTSPAVVLDKLIARYYMDTQISRNSLQIAVINALLVWVNRSFIDFEPAILTRLNGFIEQEKSQQHSQIVKQLEDAVILQQQSARLVHMKQVRVRLWDDSWKTSSITMTTTVKELAKSVLEKLQTPLEGYEIMVVSQGGRTKRLAQDAVVWDLVLMTTEVLVLKDKTSVTSGSRVEGWLFKRTKNWKRRWFVLGQNELSYYEGPPRPGSREGIKGSIPLRDTLIFDIRADSVDSKVHKFCFRLKPAQAKEYIVGCDNKGEKEEWYCILKDAIDNANDFGPATPVITHEEKLEDDPYEITTPTISERPAPQADITMEGWAWKKTRNWKRRYFILRSSSLQYYEEPPPNSQLAAATMKGLVNFKSCVLIDLPEGEKARPWMFKLKPQVGKEYVLALESKVEKDSWFSRIQQRINETNAGHRPLLSTGPSVDTENKDQVSRDIKKDQEVESKFPRTKDTKLASVRTRALFNNVDLGEVARQMTLIDARLFKEIRHPEVLNQSWIKPKPKYDPSNVIAFISRFNDVTTWVVSKILEAEYLADRSWLLEKFVSLAEHLYELNNYSALMAMLGGFNHAAVSRLKFTTLGTSKKTQQTMSDLLDLMTPSSSYKNYRAKIGACLANGQACIPYLGVTLSDMTFIDEGNPDELFGLVNLDKMAFCARAIDQLKALQRSASYRYDEVPEVFALISLKDYALLPTSNDKAFYKLSLLLEPRGVDRAQIA